MKTPNLILTLGLLSLLSTGVHADEMDSSNRPGALRPGFYLSADVGAASIDLDNAVQDRLGDLDVDVSGNASGGGLAFGYSWDNDFALELQLFGGELATGNTQIDAGLGELALAVRAPVLTHSRVAPYLEGRLGGAGIAFSGNDIEDRGVAGPSTGIGAGAEIHLSQRWAIDFGYRFSMITFQEEVLETKDGTQEIEIDGSGQMHRFAVRTTFNF